MTGRTASKENTITRPGIIQIIGIPGVGKTTVGKAAAEGLGIDFVDLADLIVSSAQSLGIKAQTHDDIIAMAPQKLQRCVDLAREVLLESSRDRTILLETHLAAYVRDIGYTFTSPNTLRERKTLSIVLIADDAIGMSKKRAARGAGRDRYRGSCREAETDQHINLISAVACCAMLGIPFMILWNKQGELHSSVNALIKHIVEVIKRV